MSEFITAIVGFIHAILSVFSPASEPVSIPRLETNSQQIVQQIIAIDDIRESDVLNAFVPAFGSDTAFQLEDGSYNAAYVGTDMDLPASIEIGTIVFGDVTGDGRKDAVAVALWCGASCGEILYAFEKKNGKTQAIATGWANGSNITDVSVADNLISVTSLDKWGREAAQEQLFIVRDGQLVETGTSPSETGTGPSHIFASPLHGIEPVTVTFIATFPDVADSLMHKATYTVDFGDGAEGILKPYPECESGACFDLMAEHTYAFRFEPYTATIRQDGVPIKSFVITPTRRAVQ